MPVVTIFNVSSYDAVLERDSNLSAPRADALRVEPRSRVFNIVLIVLGLNMKAILKSYYKNSKIKQQQRIYKNNIISFAIALKLKDYLKFDIRADRYATLYKHNWNCTNALLLNNDNFLDLNLIIKL